MQSSLCPLPISSITDNMNVLRVHQGGYVRGVLLSTTLLLDSLTQCVRGRVGTATSRHGHGHVANPWGECVDTLARLCAMQ
eukprot:7682422-Pyramimonas_sp.AAC.1